MIKRRAAMWQEKSLRRKRWTWLVRWKLNSPVLGRITSLWCRRDGWAPAGWPEIEARLSETDSKPGERSKKLDGAVNLPGDMQQRVWDLHKELKRKKKKVRWWTRFFLTASKDICEKISGIWCYKWCVGITFQEVTFSAGSRSASWGESGQDPTF